MAWTCAWMRASLWPWWGRRVRVKGTLLNILGLLERMSSGSYQLEGRETHALDDSGLTLLRRERLGFVFQFHHLLPPSPRWRK